MSKGRMEAFSDDIITIITHFLNTTLYQGELYEQS